MFVGHREDGVILDTASPRRLDCYMAGGARGGESAHDDRRAVFRHPAFSATGRRIVVLVLLMLTLTQCSMSRHS